MDDTSVMAATYRARVSSDGGVYSGGDPLKLLLCSTGGQDCGFLSFNGPAGIVQVHNWAKRTSAEARWMKSEEDGRQLAGGAENQMQSCPSSESEEREREEAGGCKVARVARTVSGGRIAESGIAGPAFGVASGKEAKKEARAMRERRPRCHLPGLFFCRPRALAALQVTMQVQTRLLTLRLLCWASWDGLDYVA